MKKRREFTVGENYKHGHNAGAYFLNFFDIQFQAEYTEGGFRALDVPGLDQEIEGRLSQDGWDVSEKRS